MGEKATLIGRIKILPPKPGTCPACGAKHDKGSGHEAASICYMLTFYQRNRRFPTREDADKLNG